MIQPLEKKYPNAKNATALIFKTMTKDFLFALTVG
jgi:hypothetical protein